MTAPFGWLCEFTRKYLFQPIRQAKFREAVESKTCHKI